MKFEQNRMVQNIQNFELYCVFVCLFFVFWIKSPYFPNINQKAYFVEKLDHLSIFPTHFNKILRIKIVTIFFLRLLGLDVTLGQVCDCIKVPERKASRRNDVRATYATCGLFLNLTTILRLN